jgi:hypothetical protein
MKIEKGTIFRNCYATLKTYFIYDHTITQRQTRDRSPAQFACGYGLVYIGGKWELSKNVKYYNIDLINDKNFKPVGKIDIDALIVKAITKEIEKHENPRACKDCVHGKFRKFVLYCDKYNVPRLFEDKCDDFQPMKTYFERIGEQGEPMKASEM